MSNPGRTAPALLVATLLGAGTPAHAASFYALTTACASFQPSCEFGGSQPTSPGAAPSVSSISRSYTFVPPPNSGGGYSIGVNSSVTFESPTTWRAYTQAGGYANVPEPFALNALTASTSATVRLSDDITALPTVTWSGAGRLRFSMLVEGSVSVSYSAPGTPDQASMAVSLGFDCSRTVPIGQSFATSPCTSPDFTAAPPGSFTLNGARRFTSSQQFSDVFDFDINVQSGQMATFNLGAGITAGMGYLYGTPVGVLNGLAVGDFLGTGRLVGVTLFDASGNVVRDAVLQSGSGFDYLSVNAAAVPAPPALGLLLTALGGLAVRARRRRTPR
ncbi:MAG: hypothetical protein J0M16_08120 [Gammaproteobacteria bacterium]|jgi:hypothetical protein|nr:hypothetical protein [Gammaproteobacteria bacterium]